MEDMIYRLVIRARFESAAELDRVVRGLERLEIQGAKVTVNMGTMGRGGAEGLEGLARSALRVGFMFNMLESAFMRATMGQVILDNAQERYNRTVEKYGANSNEAIQALKQLELRTNYLNMANMRVNVSMGLMLTQLALQSGLLKKATAAEIAHLAVTKLKSGVYQRLAAHINMATLSQWGHTAATTVATIKDWLHVAALKAKVILMGMLSGGALIPLMIAGGVMTAGAIATLTATGGAGRGEIERLGKHELEDVSHTVTEAIGTKLTSVIPTTTEAEKTVLTTIVEKPTETQVFPIITEKPTEIEKATLTSMIEKPTEMERTALTSMIEEPVARVIAIEPLRSEINIQTQITMEQDVDEALAEHNRKVKEDLRSARSE